MVDNIISLINNTNDISVLLKYITDNNIEYAIAAAQSQYATEELLNIASRDNDREVRLAALNNDNIGKEAIMYLTNDVDLEIKSLAIKKMEDIK